MARRAWLLLIGITGGLGACRNTSAPPLPSLNTGGSEESHVDNPWIGSQTASITPYRWRETRDLKLAYSVWPVQPAVEMMMSQATFWAVKGQDRTIRVQYKQLDHEAAPWRPLMEFAVPAGGLERQPDGTPIAVGDSVLITITFDTRLMQLQMGPPGLQFQSDEPARLTWWYTGSDPDLNADGETDATDAYIEANLSTIWVQDTPSADWYRLPDAVQSLADKRFDANIPHFSGYAIAW